MSAHHLPQRLASKERDTGIPSFLSAQKALSRKGMKAVSTLIATVLMIAVVFTIAAIISPWLFTLTTSVSNETSTSVTQQILCRSAKYDFDTSFKASGIDTNLSSTPDRIDVKVVNTGTVNLHGFSLEVEIDTDGSLQIKHFPINSSSQKTEALPLRPGQGAILRGNIAENLNGTLREVKVLNQVCPSNFIRQRL